MGGRGYDGVGEGREAAGWGGGEGAVVGLGREGGAEGRGGRRREGGRRRRERWERAIVAAIELQPMDQDILGMKLEQWWFSVRLCRLGSAPPTGPCMRLKPVMPSSFAVRVLGEVEPESPQTAG